MLNTPLTLLERRGTTVHLLKMKSKSRKPSQKRKKYEIESLPTIKFPNSGNNPFVNLRQDQSTTSAANANAIPPPNVIGNEEEQKEPQFNPRPPTNTNEAMFTDVGDKLKKSVRNKSQTKPY